MQPRTILELYERRGFRASGTAGVSPLQHAWQCGRLARAAGASPSLQLAAWLHDLGHLLDEGAPSLQPLDRADETRAAASAAWNVAALRRHRNQHALRGAAVLLPLFGPTVSGPIALHAEAKRCLAALRPAYRRNLSAAALHQLALEGGAMPLPEARAFMQRPHAPAALRLRLWDDAARDPHVEPPSFNAALDTAARLMRLLEGGARVVSVSSALSARQDFVPLPASRPGQPTSGLPASR